MPVVEPEPEPLLPEPEPLTEPEPLPESEPLPDPEPEPLALPESEPLPLPLPESEPLPLEVLPEAEPLPLEVLPEAELLELLEPLPLDAVELLEEPAGGAWQVPPEQLPLWQSPSLAQCSPAAQGRQYLPPQSWSDSVASWTSSAQLGVAHAPLLQIPPAQSVPELHCLPSVQVPQLPPQSVSVSLPFFWPS